MASALGSKLSHIALGSVPLQSVVEMLADTFALPAATVAPLASLLHRKTLGNPFFLCTLLKGKYVAYVHARTHNGNVALHGKTLGNPFFLCPRFKGRVHLNTTDACTYFHTPKRLPNMLADTL